MPLKIYNSLSKQKEDFIPVNDKKVRMYVCGMTVYSDAHIGHARTYFAFDVIRRYLKHLGYDVYYVQNVTDVDDKIIAAAHEKQVDALEFSCGCTDRCLGDLDKLGIQRADFYPKASATIEDMIQMIQQIIENGYGYEAGGDVYFSVEQFPDYGKLSGQNIEELKSGARIEPGEKKKSPLDFALWKEAKPGEPYWESPWGKGRPGWHIECSTMSAKYLGLPFDIHGGGMDLRFPHHENEIAQAEAATGKDFAKYWMHSGLLTVNGEKMSKSLGNMINIHELLKSWPAEVIRFFFTKTHYRRPPDFSEKALQIAEKGVNRIHRFKKRLEELSVDRSCVIQKDKLSEEDTRFYEMVNQFQQDFEQAMNDDFNTPEAVAAMFSFMNQVNGFLEEHNTIDKELARFALDVFVKLAKIVTLFQEESDVTRDVLDAIRELYKSYVPDKEPSENMEEMLDELLCIRQQARENKDWAKADKIRDEIECLGFEVQDTTDGSVCRKLR